MPRPGGRPTRLGGWGPDGVRRLVVATADPGTLPDKATWYLVTNLPRPGGPREADSDHPAAGLAEIVRLCAVRNWIEQSYKQVKDELGWADFQVRSDLAIRRHQAGRSTPVGPHQVDKATRPWSTAHSHFAGPLLPDVQRERGGVIGGGACARHERAPPGGAGRGLVFMVSPGCSF
jgi:hypothetical protein